MINTPVVLYFESCGPVNEIKIHIGQPQFLQRLLQGRNHGVTTISIPPNLWVG